MSKRKRLHGTHAVDGSAAEPVVEFQSSKKVKAASFLPVTTDSGSVETTAAIAVPATKATDSSVPNALHRTITIQIVAGSYDRILHGVTAAIATQEPAKDGDGTNHAELEKGADQNNNLVVSFADSFLFSAHSAAIRCLAISPPSAPQRQHAQTVLLASGSADERINMYALSAHRPRLRKTDGSGGGRSGGTNAQLSAAAVRPILEDHKNRELGTLLHHAGAVTSLFFPSRSKLLSSSDDSTVAITRARDWQLLQAIRAPVPRARPGRPSGDTAPAGAAPSGIADFAVHPSMKLMLTVGRGERCMRLWNLVTGRRAGALEFPRDLLRDLTGRGGASYASGEGRSVVWGATIDDGDEFAVVFDRDAVVFSIDCLPKCRVLGHSRTKLHRLRYFSVSVSATVKEPERRTLHLLAASTEDGRILFISTERSHLLQPEATGLPVALTVAQIGEEQGTSASTSRIKDFVILQDIDPGSGSDAMYVVAGSSDGRLRVWLLHTDELAASVAEAPRKLEQGPARKVGALLGTYETHNRITCIAAFVMLDRPDGLDDDETEFEETEFEDTEEDVTDDGD